MTVDQLGADEDEDIDGNGSRGTDTVLSISGLCHSTVTLSTRKILLSVSQPTDSLPCSMSQITVLPTPARDASRAWESPAFFRWLRVISANDFIYCFSSKNDHKNTRFQALMAMSSNITAKEVIIDKFLVRGEKLAILGNYYRNSSN
jgi:hypothetical protein